MMQNSAGKTTILLGAVIALASCTQTFHGAEPILTSKGVEVSSEDEGTDGNGGEYILFKNAEENAHKDTTNAGTALEMVNTGFGLVYANCDRYFRAAGKTQQKLIVARDALAIMGTLATGLFAAAHASNAATAISGLVTATGYAAIDTVTKDYLFAADNIDQVRTLTLNAIAKHQRDTLALNPRFTYHTAFLSLLDNQNYCTLRSIASLARDAIKNGEVVQTSNTPASNTPASNTPERDLRQISAGAEAEIRSELKKMLGGPGSLSDAELIALYWYLASDQRPDSADLTKFIGTILSKDPNGPVDASGKAVAGANFDQSRARDLLKQLSGETQDAIAGRIQAQHALSTTTASAASRFSGFSALALPPPAPRAPANTATTFNRVTIGIRQVR